MGFFLLNEMGEVLLELVSGLNFAMDMRLEINEGEQSAVLKSGNESVEVGFVHEDLMLALKMRRYLFVAERNNAFFLKNSRLAKVVFVG